MAKFYKRPIFIIGAIILVAVIVGVVLKFTSNDQNNFESVTAIQANLTQRVSVTGNVKPAESIDMSFETSGVIASIDVKVGDKVTAGQTLARLKSAELSADLSQAQANLASRRAMEAQAEASLEAEKNTLADYLKGTRSEEIQIAQTDVNNAQINLTNATENANVALNKLYSEVDGILNEAYTDANDAIGNQIDALFSNDFTDNPKLELTLSNSSLKNSAQDQRAQATNSLEAIRTTIDGLNTT
ncbi:MAG: biotin/lipoyl-binding protein, partial [Patescibacteria group bacterium]